VITGTGGSCRRHPLDGSWSYFSTAPPDYDAKNLKTKFDAVYITSGRRPDDWMPTLDNSSAYALTETERARRHPLRLEQVLSKASGLTVISSTRRRSGLANGDDANIFTLGARLVATPVSTGTTTSKGLPIRRENGPNGPHARECGPPVARPQRLRWQRQPRLPLQDSHEQPGHLVFEYLSGDDPTRPERPRCRRALGRWPRERTLHLFLRRRDGREVRRLNN